ncbi:sensor histidine kinase [Gemmatirosa kalamazoonensis]|uniref:sensor histidine kinase n=1 Tax=Gemmatirosa kalamazoonensis TaxID=861299 RepID=UPI00046D3605|nr:HAMP domain-containing sensor histidine kinase [Gemmatirosa kalamazoonensis]
MHLSHTLRTRRSGRSLYVACALLGSVVLVAIAVLDGLWGRRLLARETRRALEDDAAVIARGVATGVQYAGFDALAAPFELVLDDLRPEPARLPSLADFARLARRAWWNGDSVAPPVPTRVAVARLDAATGRFEFLPAGTSPAEDSAAAREVQDVLRRATAAGTDRAGPRRDDRAVQLWVRAGGSGPLFRGVAHAAHVPTSRAPIWYAALAYRPDFYRMLVPDVLATIPVLPATYAGPEWDVNRPFAVDSTLVAIRVVDRETNVPLYTRPARWPARYAVEGVVDNRRGDHGVRIEVRLAERLAAQLVTAAPERAHDALPWLLLAVAAGLALSSLWMLRIEHRVAQQQISFLAQLSHELRTPLTRLRLHADMLRLGRARSAEQRERVTGVIERATRDLTALVENVLTLTRAELPDWRINRTPQRLDALVADAVRDFEPQALARDACIEVTRLDPCGAECDATLVRQVVTNLLDNAVKYGPTGQRIRVSLEVLGTTAAIRVCDEGPGIAPADRERIWHLYTRLGDGQRRASGSGLGLGVVRAIVAQHGGTVATEDGADACGACLVVALPIVEVEGAAPAASEREPAPVPDASAS